MLQFQRSEWRNNYLFQKLNMNAQKIVKELKVKYPGKNIILDPPKNPSEIICEI